MCTRDVSYLRSFRHQTPERQARGGLCFVQHVPRGRQASQVAGHADVLTALAWEEQHKAAAATPGPRRLHRSDAAEGRSVSPPCTGLRRARHPVFAAPEYIR